MSRKHAPAPKAAVEMGLSPPGATCADCKHWRRRAADYGQCVESPPDHAARVTPHGPLCLYPVTAADLPACGRVELPTELKLK